MKVCSVICVIVGLVAGCGRSDLHRVSGQVSFGDGSPLSVGRVVVSYEDGSSSWGRIQKDGSFRVGTKKDGDGMRGGTYRVAVKDAIVPTENGEPGGFKQIVHPRFADPATSGLEFTVPDQTTWNIVVEKP
jgi:hypothetical protein